MIPASLSNHRGHGLAVLALVAGLSGCLGGNEHESTPSRPAVLSFTAAPATVAPGASTVLSWNVVRADTVSIAPGIGQVTGTSITIRPVASTTYVLSATNAGGTTTASVTVTTSAPPAGLTYVMNPATYPAGVAIVPNLPSSTGGPISSYSVSPALPTGLSLDPTTGVISGTPAAETATATYSVTGSNAAGAATVPLVLTVSAAPPPTISAFTATPPSIAAGGSSVLAWTVTGATTLSIDQGVGPVVGTSTTVSPVATTTYRLSASNGGGTSTADVTVQVTGAPTNLRYATNPASYLEGVAIAANAPAWDGGTPTSFAGTVPPGLALDPATGVVTGTPTTVAPATPYTITASNASGSATVVLNVTVTEAVLPPTNLVYSENPAVYTVGTPIARNLPANGGGPIAEYAVGATTPLPAGLSLDPATGTLTGTPTAVTTGPTTCTVTGRNAAGSTSVDLILTVNNPVLAIVTQPANQSALPGQTATFSVVASGVNLHYQWKRSGTTDVGADQASYTTPVLTAADGGSTYGVVVTDGASATVTSRDAVLDLRGFFPVPGPMTDAVYGHTATLLDDGRVLIAGGNVRGAGSTVIAQLYDPTTRTFTRTANDMSSPRQGHAAVKLLDGRVLIVGGCRAGALFCSQFLSTIELFDPATNRFLDPAPTARMATPRMYLAAALLPGADGRVLLAGGYVNGATITSSADVFDPGSGPGSETIAATGSMSTPRAFAAAVTLPADGTILVAGGQAVVSNVPVALSTAETYRLAIGALPSAGGFAVTGALAGGRSNGVATPPGVDFPAPVLLTGGTGSGIRPTSLARELPGLLGVQQFEGAAFVTSGPLDVERNWQTATRLRVTGEVLVTGGNSMATYLSSAEIHDPVLGASTLVPSMRTPRAQHTATLLLDGTVLVAGGRTGPVGSVGTTLSSAEVWAPYPYPPVP